ncbi:MAG: hypothetical protein IH585_09195 [Anaerolineaceae bacterium]|nr:hypothetical protein [Anaerolineaceae bacterium]
MKHLAVFSLLTILLLSACATDQEVAPLVVSVSPDIPEAAESWWQPETRLTWQ